MTKEAIQKETLKMLSKQGSDQLLSKLKAGVLMGMSKESAFEILKKRGVEIPKELLPKGETWVRPKSTTSKKEIVKRGGKGGDISLTEKTVKEEASKQKKGSVVKEKKGLSKSFSIREMLKKGLSYEDIREELAVTLAYIRAVENYPLKNEKTAK